MEQLESSFSDDAALQPFAAVVVAAGVLVAAAALAGLELAAEQNLKVLQTLVAAAAAAVAGALLAVAASASSENCLVPVVIELSTFAHRYTLASKVLPCKECVLASLQSLADCNLSKLVDSHFS